MIIKNLSRKNADGSGQLVKYIFKYIFRDSNSKTRKELDRALFYPKGIWLSEKDLKYERAEIFDIKLLADFKAKYPNYDYEAYINGYLLPKGNENGKDGEEVTPFIIKHNMRANSLNGFIREFENNEKGRINKRADQTNVHHTILSWSNKDSAYVTEKMLRDISKEYIRLRGESNMYVGTVHTDRAHIHLHIAMSGTTLDGKSARLSKQDFENVKVKLQEYQQEHYPELANSLPSHGKVKKEKQKEEVKKIYRTERQSSKNNILKCIETAYPLAESSEHFVSLLKENGYEVYHRNGQLMGIQDGGYKYRFSRLGLDIKALMQLDELQEIRGNKKAISIEDRLKELDDTKRRQELQSLVNRRMEFEERHGNFEASNPKFAQHSSMQELEELRNEDRPFRDTHADQEKDRSDENDDFKRDGNLTDEEMDEDTKDDKDSPAESEIIDDDGDEQTQYS